MLLRPLAEARRAGVFLDFAGTLSEIAPTPEAAVAVPGAIEALEALAGRYVVAIVSGRRASEVAARLGSPDGVTIHGLYGSQETAASAPLVAEASTAVHDLEGVRVEPKGPNVAVHYRLAPDPDGARAIVLQRLAPLAASRAMRTIEGKRVVELAPGDAPTKGSVIEREGAALDALCYAGDDLADLDAFAAVDRLAAAGRTGVKVAVRSAETPHQLLDAADVVVDGPSTTTSAASRSCRRVSALRTAIFTPARPSVTRRSTAANASRSARSSPA